MNKVDLTRPIIGIENRTAQEAFDIMCDRIRSAAPTPSPLADAQGEQVDLAERCRDVLDWRATGRLREGALSRYAQRLEATGWSEPSPPRKAEQDTITEALIALAAQQPRAMPGPSREEIARALAPIFAHLDLMTERHADDEPVTDADHIAVNVGQLRALRALWSPKP